MFFIRRVEPARCPQCGQRATPSAAACPLCGAHLAPEIRQRRDGPLERAAARLRRLRAPRRR